jgi:hypothetical protein
MAAEKNHVEILHKLWVWAEEAQQNANELKQKLLLAKDKYGITAWNLATLFGRLQALEALWSWAKEAELNPHELLLAQNEEGCTILHVASEKKHVEILHKRCVCTKEAQLNAIELKKKILPAKDNYGITAWHLAALFCRLQALETLWIRAKEVEPNRDDLLLALSEQGKLCCTWQQQETL